MQISEFIEWASKNGFVNPVVKEERREVLSKKKEEIFSSRTRKTGKQIYTFVSREGRVIDVVCGKRGIIERVYGSGEEEIGVF